MEVFRLPSGTLSPMQLLITRTKDGPEVLASSPVESYRFDIQI